MLSNLRTHGIRVICIDFHKIMQGVDRFLSFIERKSIGESKLRRARKFFILAMHIV